MPLDGHALQIHHPVSHLPSCSARVQTLFNALLENNCSEHASRMTAMENSTKSAGDMLNRLTLAYNRQVGRQQQHVMSCQASDNACIWVHWTAAVAASLAIFGVPCYTIRTPTCQPQPRVAQCSLSLGLLNGQWVWHQWTVSRLRQVQNVNLDEGALWAGTAREPAWAYAVAQISRLWFRQSRQTSNSPHMGAIDDSHWYSGT